MLVQATNAFYNWVESKMRDVTTIDLVNETALVVDQFAQIKIGQTSFNWAMDGIIIGAIAGGLGAYKLQRQLSKDDSMVFIASVCGAAIIVGSTVAGGVAGASFGAVKAIHFHN